MGDWRAAKAALTAAQQSAFGDEPVTIAGSGASVMGIFKAPYESQDPYGVETEARDPMLYLMPADAVGLDEGDVLTIRGDTYTVVDRQPRHDSQVALKLRRYD